MLIRSIYRKLASFSRELRRERRRKGKTTGLTVGTTTSKCGPGEWSCNQKHTQKCLCKYLTEINTELDRSPIEQQESEQHSLLSVWLNRAQLSQNVGEGFYSFNPFALCCDLKSNKTRLLWQNKVNNKNTLDI